MTKTDQAQIIITDDGSGTGTTTWTQNNTYILDGFVFINAGDVLTIEPGTVVKGKSGSGAEASALIVALHPWSNLVLSGAHPTIRRIALAARRFFIITE